MKPRVYVSYALPKTWLSPLYKHCTVVLHPKKTPPTRAQFLSGTRTAHGVLGILNETIDEQVFKQSPDLKIVANYAVGYDNIDLAMAKKYHIAISHTPGNLVASVAEHAMGLLLAVAKHIVQADAFTRAGKYRFWDPLLFLGGDIKGKTLGIVGVGRIGSELAAMAHKGFGMRILYTDVVKNTIIETNCSAQKVPLKQLLSQSDFVSLHVPLMPSTRHLIGKDELSCMKKTAYLINTARGAVVDEKALVSALRKKTIAGAGLDVFEFEPKLSAGLTQLPNVVLTPHSASATESARKEMADIAVENLLDVLVRGKRPRNEVV